MISNRNVILRIAIAVRVWVWVGEEPEIKIGNAKIKIVF
jgi:hypothetical protein